MLPKLYKTLFWLGYIAVLITSLLNINWHLNRVKVRMVAFELRLDHLLHLAVYFLICMYYLYGQWKGFKLFQKKAQLKFILAVFFLATVTEVLQIWVPERSFNVMDWVANVAGIFLGVVIIKIQDQRKF